MRFESISPYWFTMNAHHEHLSRHLTEKLRAKGVVVWYDPRRQFTAYVGALIDESLPQHMRCFQHEIL